MTNLMEYFVFILKYFRLAIATIAYSHFRLTKTPGNTLIPANVTGTAQYDWMME